MSKINPHNHPVVEHSFRKGANNSIQPEVSTDQEGLYYDGDNIRVVDVDGETTAAVRIDGEEVLYTISELGGLDWTALWFGVVRSRFVVIWAHDSNSLDSAVSVDNEVVLQSSNFPVSTLSELQVGVDESCAEGEIFCTDNFSPPFFLSVEDMLREKAAGSSKYFDDFVFENYSINFDSPADHPIIIGLADVGAGNGLPVGKYSYMIRFVDSDGNVANPSYPTPLVFVPRNYIGNSDYEGVVHNDQWAGVKNYGADSDSAFNTAYAPVIKFRVTNLVGYSSVELIRSSWNTGAGLGYTPVKEIIKKFEISSDEISIIEFVDSISNEDTPQVITLDEITGDALEIERAKAVRYFDRRVELGNIRYRKLNEGDINFIQEAGVNHMFAVTKPIGKLGHAEAVNEAYRKTLMHKEKYSYGLLAIPSNLQKIFVQPIRDNLLVPSRRDKVENASEVHSESAVVAATIDGEVAETFEVFDLESATAPTNNASGFNIRQSTPYNYRPLKPTSVDDLDHDYKDRRMSSVYLDDADSTKVSWNPYGFGLDWHVTGMALAGLSSYPSWLKAFSVVKRPRPGRVVIQGLVTYKIEEDGQGATDGCIKDLNEVFFFSPDLDNGTIGLDVITQLENAQSGDYKIEMISPLGFFSEFYNAHEHGAGGKNDSHIDMISYARVLKDKNSLGINFENPGDNYPGIPDGVTPHTQLGYTAYGNWRNDTGNPFYPSNANGDKLWTINSITKEELEEGYSRWCLELTENIYLATASNKNFKDTGGKRFHEPWYIANIILEGVENSTSNVQDYLPSEHYQKVDAIVGKSSGASAEEFEMVDERWEDFHTEGSGIHDVVKRVYIDNGDGILRRYVNSNLLSVSELALLDADIATGGGTTFDGIPVWGKFGSTRKVVQFGSSLGFTTLETGSIVHIFYDNRFPCITYGDSYVGNALGVKLHQRKDSANSWDADGDFRLNAAYPYFGWDKPDGYYYCRRTTVGSFSILEPDSPPHAYSLSRVRQMVVNYPVTSFSHIPLAYAQHFPLVNYVMRPNRFDPLLSPSDQEIFPEYEDDYPGELDRWMYGGFRLNQVPVNADYSQEQNSPQLFSRPAIGFVDNVDFCTRVIWSLTRPINVSYFPGLRTFPINHIYDLDDRRGQIQFLFDSVSGGVRNLYAFLEDDVALLVTNNVQINTLDGQQLAIQGDSGQSGFVQKDIFLGLQGMPENTWMSVAEDENGLFFINHDSAYYFEGTKLKDIGRPFYRKTIWDEIISKAIDNKYVRFTSVFDTKYREFWTQFSNGINSGIEEITQVPPETFIVNYSDFEERLSCIRVNNGRSYADVGISNLPKTFESSSCFCNTGPEYINLYEYTGTTRDRLIGQVPPFWCGRLDYQNMQWVIVEDKTCDTCEVSYNQKGFNFGTQIDNWNGGIGYRFDRFASKDSKTYGARNAQIYRLHSGNQISGANIRTRLRIQVSPEGAFLKEFVRLRLNSTRKPTRIRVYDSAWSNVVAQIEMEDLRNYGGGFEQYIPRNILSRDRQQGNVLRLEIFDEESQDIAFRLLNVQYKLIK